MTAEHLQSLLSALEPEGAERYEQLRWRLVRLFGWERCSQPEALADEALDRLARRLAENEPIGKVESYLFGIARLLLREEAQRRVRDRQKLAEFAYEKTRLARPSDERLQELLNRCLQELPAPDREMLLAYYHDRDRDRLAASLGLRVNALRNRALRLREKLEKV